MFWSVDAAGNVGSNATLTWFVDSSFPQAVWPVGLPNLTKSNVLDLAFGCTKVDCHFEYSFDGGPMRLSSHSNATTSNVTGLQSVDTQATLMTPSVSTSTTAVISLRALDVDPNTGIVLNSSLPAIGNGTHVQVG